MCMRWRPLGGTPALLVPDNAKEAVIKACLYDPQVNRSYAEMAAHYGSAVLPARPRRPRDKAKVEAAVRIVERWLLGRLRHRVFYSLAEVNAAIGELLTELNDRRVLRRVGRTRRQLFEEIDQPALKPLPVERYVYAEWRIRRAGLDYHVEIDRHHYSVPWRFAREQIEARITANTVELSRKGERIAAHRRSSGNGKHTTVPEHMPSAHRRFADWTIERISREASAIGSDAALLVEKILAERPHPEQGFRACLGIIRLAKGLAGKGSTLPAAARSRSARGPTAPVRSILDNLSTRRRRRARRQPSRSTIPISAAPVTTTEKENGHAYPSYPRPVERSQPDRHGQGLCRTCRQWRGRTALPCRKARLAHRPGMELAPRPQARRPPALRHQAAPEDVDYRSERGLDRALFLKLIAGDWIDAHDNLAIRGPAGVGKSWLAPALGHKACRGDRSVLYQRLPRLFANLALARGDGRYARFTRKLGSVQLLILDDWGLEPLDDQARHDLLEILEDRYGEPARPTRGPVEVMKKSERLQSLPISSALKSMLAAAIESIPGCSQGDTMCASSKCRTELCRDRTARPYATLQRRRRRSPIRPPRESYSGNFSLTQRERT
jgi:transposase